MSLVSSDLSPAKSIIEGISDISDTASFQSNSIVHNPSRKAISKVAYGSPVFSSNSSLNSSTYQRSRRFDERLRSRLSGISRNISLPSHNGQNGQSNQESASTEVSLKWVNLKSLNNLLYSVHTRALYGEPICIASGDIVAIGSSRGYILIFNYRQELIHTLGKNSKALSSGTLTTLALSSDSTHVAAGFENGDIFLWNLNSPSRPLAHIQPLAGITSATDGHIKGSSINNISFVGKRHTVLVSADIHGLVFYHQANRGVLGFNVATRKILGKYEEIGSLSSSTVFACSALPLGSSIEFADTLGLAAIMTAQALIIISTTHAIRTQFKTGRPKATNDSLGKSGCLSWFPAVISKSGSKIPAKLAYCFSNIITIIEVDSNDGSLRFDLKKRWVCEELILSIQWVNHSLISIVTPTQQLILLNEKSMTVTNTIDLLSQHLYKYDFYSKLDSSNGFVDGFNSSISSFKGKLFFVGKYEIHIGSPPNWADLLLNLVNKGDFKEAIEAAGKYYVGSKDTESIGLPLTDEVRHSLVLEYLIKIINASTEHVLNPKYLETHTLEDLKDYLYISIRSLVLMKSENAVLDDLFEAFSEHGYTNLFFEALEPFILNGSIKSLAPIILKNMVSYYISIDQADKLEEYICLLDIESLDIDFTISLLKKNHLIDSYIYIWNRLIHDYVSPFLEFVSAIKQGKDESFKVFSYIAYILTGRQYPTENLIPEPEAETAKLVLNFILFNGMPVSFDNGKLSVDSTMDVECAFPYLNLLIKLDLGLFLSSMNEILEDTLLNDDEVIHEETQLKVNRQFIIEILLEIFNNDDYDFSDEDRLHFAIFLARNYPKFQQFIRLSDVLLDNIIKSLCSFEGDDGLKEDCELSLQSLLSVYQPSNKRELMGYFEKAGFYEVLINLYLNDGKYSKVLETWLKLDKVDSIDTTYGVLERCLKSTEKNSKERKLVDKVIKENFVEIIEANTYKIVDLINKFSPGLHSLVEFMNDEQLKYMYLSSLSQLESNGSFRFSPDQRDAYVQSLSLVDKNLLLKYVKTLSPGEYHLDGLIPTLRSNNCVEALVYLLQKEGKIDESLTEVINHMKSLLGTFENTKSEDVQLSIETDLWKSLREATDIANNKTVLETKNGNVDGLSKNEKFWLRLINFHVQTLKEYEDGRKPTKVLDIVRRLLQDLFSTLINSRSEVSFKNFNESSNEARQSSFLRIFMEFLSTSSIKVAVLRDVKSVTNEVYLAFLYEKNVLTITSNLINEVIYKNMQTLSEKNVSGWSVDNYECDSCGKVIWGRGISSQSYTIWEHKQLGLGFDAKNFDLVTFDCRHCYHKACLENFGEKDHYKCVICDDKSRKI